MYRAMHMNKRINNLKDDAEELAAKVREKVAGYILAGLGLVSALAWNDAIKALIEQWYPLGQDSVLAKLYYAFIMTLIIVVASIVVIKITKKGDEEK